jgi:ribosomal protein S18 acetylase RimI-like enzyme
MKHCGRIGRGVQTIDACGRRTREGWSFLARRGYLAKQRRWDARLVLSEATLATEVTQQGVTAVHPDYRGRGIARALKLRTLEYARQHVYREIRTQMDETNAPMLHVNQAIGFVKHDGFVVFERRVSG